MALLIETTVMGRRWFFSKAGKIVFMNNFNFKNENLLIIFVISKEKNVLISAIDRNIYIFFWTNFFVQGFSRLNRFFIDRYLSRQEEFLILLLLPSQNRRRERERISVTCLQSSHFIANRFWSLTFVGLEPLLNKVGFEKSQSSDTNKVIRQD